MEDAKRGNKGCQLANRKEAMCTKGEAMMDNEQHPSNLMLK